MVEEEEDLSLEEIKQDKQAQSKVIADKEKKAIVKIFCF